jgi:hypothetical protein
MYFPPILVLWCSLCIALQRPHAMFVLFCVLDMVVFLVAPSPPFVWLCHVPPLTIVCLASLPFPFSPPPPPPTLLAPQGVLLCGLTSSQVQAVVVGPAHAGGHHLSSVLKFVALRDATKPADVMPLGGAWSSSLDGGDPAR